MAYTCVHEQTLGLLESQRQGALLKLREVKTLALEVEEMVSYYDNAMIVLNKELGARKNIPGRGDRILPENHGRAVNTNNPSSTTDPTKNGSTMILASAPEASNNSSVASNSNIPEANALNLATEQDLIAVLNEQTNGSSNGHGATQIPDVEQENVAESASNDPAYSSSETATYNKSPQNDEDRSYRSAIEPKDNSTHISSLVDQVTLASVGGKRSPKDMIYSKYAGMKLRSIIESILKEAREPVSSGELVTAIFTPQDEEEYVRAKTSLATELNVGAKKGYWERSGRGLYRALEQ